MRGEQQRAAHNNGAAGVELDGTRKKQSQKIQCISPEHRTLFYIRITFISSDRILYHYGDEKGKRSVNNNSTSQKLDE
jgi:hypothetical protein